jgi:hypothetical protein
MNYKLQITLLLEKRQEGLCEDLESCMKGVLKEVAICLV